MNELLDSRISVVIPVRNGAATLGGCLDALAGQRPFERLEVLVVDDGSEDRSAEIAGQRPFCRVIRQEYRGAAAARNRGLKEAHGRLVAFLDADCCPATDWIERLIAPLADPAVDGVVGRFVSHQEAWVARLVQLDLDLRYSRMASADTLDFVNTATCAFRRSALGEDPFDEDFGKLEDLDFSFRLAAKGVRIRFAPDAVVEHSHPTSLVQLMKRRFLYGRFAPELYRRHSSRLAADSATPHSRRLQLIFLALGVVMLPWYWPAGLAGLLGSALFSFPLIVRSLQASPLLAIKALPYLWGGNLAFLAGSVTGLLRTLPSFRR